MDSDELYNHTYARAYRYFDTAQTLDIQYAIRDGIGFLYVIDNTQNNYRKNDITLRGDIYLIGTIPIELIGHMRPLPIVSNSNSINNNQKHIGYCIYNIDLAIYTGSEILSCNLFKNVSLSEDKLTIMIDDHVIELDLEYCTFAVFDYSEDGEIPAPNTTA